jgi:hypothetical protein
VGLVGLEPTTPALSRRCSNQLSYRPFTQGARRRSSKIRQEPNTRTARRGPAHTTCCVQLQPIRVGAQFRVPFGLCSFDNSDPACKIDRCRAASPFSRKEVIQPHLPIRLPCYDFTPVTNPAVVIAPLAVRLTTSGRTRSHGVTGGVYKTRERIHRGKLIRDY